MARSGRSRQSSWGLVDPIVTGLSSVARKVIDMIVGNRRRPPPSRRKRSRREEPSQLRIEYYRDRSKSPLRLEYHREQSASLLQLEYHRNRSPSPFSRRTKSGRTDNERDRYSFRSERRYSRDRENRYARGGDRGGQPGSKRGQDATGSQRRSHRDRETRRSSINSRDDRSPRKPAKDAPRSQKRNQRDREGRHSLPTARDDRAERRRSREVSSSQDRHARERRPQYNAPTDGSLRSRESRARGDSLSRRQSHGEQERREHPVVMTSDLGDRAQLRKSLPPPVRYQVDGGIPSSAAEAERGQRSPAPSRLAQSDTGRTQEGSPIPGLDDAKQDIQCFSVAIEDNHSDINPTREPSLLRRKQGFERVIHNPTGIATGSQIGRDPDLRAPGFSATNPDMSLPTSDTQECVICREPRQLSEFPILSVTTACDHPPRTCFNCIQRQIKTNMQSRHWKDVHCPECNEMLEYHDVERLASPTSLERYDRFSFQEAINDNPDIFECVAGCGNVQYHVSGSAHPIVMCAKCGTRACYTHRTEWHKDMTCEEYDQYILDPDNFKTRAQREEEEAELREEAQLQEEADRIQRERQDAHDRRVADELATLEQALAQNNEAERQQRVDGRRQRERHRERDRDRERQSQRERDREREHQRRARQKEVDKKRRAAAQKSKRDDAASLATIGRISKPCPGCKRPIEKNDGCQHMTCSQCRYQFCWKCSTRWSSAHFDCDS